MWLLIFLFWVTYSIIVVIYLGYIRYKYLVSIHRDLIIGNQQLKSYQLLRTQYENVDEINVLILTGGGMRGMIPVTVLADIEKQTGKMSGELFDFIAGASTGAITAGVLSMGNATDTKYQYSAQDLLDYYVQNAKAMFHSPWYHQLLSLFGIFAPKVLPTQKLAILRRYFRNKTIGELKGNILIPVYDIENNKLTIIKNWTTPHGIYQNNFLIRDLTHGASNPPMIFIPSAFQIKDQKYLFIDAAVLLNNPILYVVFQLNILFPYKKINIVEIGNGGHLSNKYNYRNMFSFGLYGLYQYLFNAPAVGSEIYTKLIEDYLNEAQGVEQRLTYTQITGTLNENISTFSTSQHNIKKIQNYAQHLLATNNTKIEQVIKMVMKRFH